MAEGTDLRTVTVRTARLLLRSWRAEDAPDVAAACADPEVQRWIVSMPSPYTADDARSYVTGVAEPMAAGTDLILAVAEHTGRVVGSVGLHRIGDVRGNEIGYWVAPWARGLRYAAEATDGVAGWAFGRGLHRVHLLAATANVASCRTAELAGFHREGVLRESFPDRAGTPRDMALYGRLAGDPPAAMLTG